MLFYRSKSGPSRLTVPAALALSALALAAYPVGALMVDHAQHSALISLAGYALVAAALFAAVPLAGSSLQRIVAEVPSKLDEYELQLRARAMNGSYSGFTALVLAGVMYAGLASDHGGWIPATYEQFNGLFRGVFLYAVVTPVAVMSWLVDPTFETER